MTLAANSVLLALLFFGQSTPTPDAQPPTPPAQASPQQDSPSSPQPTPPSSAQPSAITQPAAPDQTKHDQSAPQPSAPASQAPPANPAQSPAPKKKSKHARKTKPAPGDEPTKVVVRNGSTPDPNLQFSPSESQKQASADRLATSQLLDGTDANLKKLASRHLKLSEQDTVNQIHTYMTQAKAALDAEDLQRAHNLAVKASLLSQELLRH